MFVTVIPNENFFQKIQKFKHVNTYDMTNFNLCSLPGKYIRTYTR